MLNLVPQPKLLEMQETPGFHPGCKSSISILMKGTDERIDILVGKAFKESEIGFEILENYFGYCLMINCGERFVPDGTPAAGLETEKEGYYLKIRNNSVIIYSWYPQGLFYGIQTLRQIIENHIVIPSLEITDWPDMEMRGMHYDLRLSYPRFDNLVKYIEEFARFKINTLMIEYEDKFPFDRHHDLRHEELCLSDEQLELIRKTAYENFIQLIPLQQSFGHLEYVLKHNKYIHLRETYEAVGELCPSKPESLELSKSLTKEIMDKHPGSKYIHIGCDEVWSLCSCDVCKNRYNGSREQTFIDFINKLVEFVASKKKIPVIWHDMLEKCSDSELKTLDKRVLVMIWLYYVKGSDVLISDISGRFRRNGIEVMGASAARCFDNGVLQGHPDVGNRITNIIKWADSAKKEKINCLVSTNWGTNFGMGCPYGIFETSWYLNVFSSEMYWNREADSGSFLSRFLAVFHGAADYTVEVYKVSGIEDYFKIAGNIVGELTRNVGVAEIIEIMNRYDRAVSLLQDVERHAFRAAMFRDVEVEKLLLRVKFNKGHSILKDVVLEMKEKLKLFLPEQIAGLFMESRIFMHDFLKENLYEKLFLDSQNS